MVVEKVIGRLSKEEKRHVEYVSIEWFEAFKKLHKKRTSDGEEIGIRMDNRVLTRGLREGDLLYEDDQRVIAVHIPSCEAMVIQVLPNHLKSVAQVCYEVGNTHGSLFSGEDEWEFLTPVNDPLMKKLQKIHGVGVEKRVVHFDFDEAISSTIHNHHH